MDLATENRIAALLLKEAAELRRQAEKEGALSYLHKPTVRGRPNSRFLTATVLGIQQANRAVEVNEMWRQRQKELEDDNRNKRRSENENMNKCRSEDENRSTRNHKDAMESRVEAKRHSDVGYTSSASCSSKKRDIEGYYCRSEDENRSTRNHKDAIESRVEAKRHSDVGYTSSASCSSKKRDIEGYYSSEDGLRDDEVENFLRSRDKRGRGTIGSRMDETGPYPSRLEPEEKKLTGPDMGPRVDSRGRAIVGPDKPLWLDSSESSDDDKMKVSKKYHSRKHKSKSKSREKDKKRRGSKRRKSH